MFQPTTIQLRGKQTLGVQETVKRPIRDTNALIHPDGVIPMDIRIRVKITPEVSTAPRREAGTGLRLRRRLLPRARFVTCETQSRLNPFK